jgi:hypothetical protein
VGFLHHPVNQGQHRIMCGMRTDAQFCATALVLDLFDIDRIIMVQNG